MAAIVTHARTTTQMNAHRLSIFRYGYMIESLGGQSVLTRSATPAMAALASRTGGGTASIVGIASRWARIVTAIDGAIKAKKPIFSRIRGRIAARPLPSSLRSGQ